MEHINKIMSLLESDELKIKILKILSKSKNPTSLNGLRVDLGRVNYTSTQRNCEFS